ncbi:uncharacterized protein (DUF2062 family) [Streptomyces achromogenes]|uniref:Uncharacterized protein (DUF2062 family) n=1 Tax=Streptomyces achromogenes TaxID=67255 RepID=A0ABU0QDQ7_STRAH|nr:hypothetical protein [Streptomyces achromogenes]MDQ0688787.1 uncharacterized protein (DUF2062 family) [Streptomyces achromogenes]MDQ0835981.1 uncharacterized protein (DUF2062 family) [Streptomyces achromogenes]
MMNMLKWVLDLGLAFLLSGLEVAALVAFWFVEGMKKWAAKGGPVPGETSRFFLVLSVGSASLALTSYGLSWADLPVAYASQAVLAALLTSLLILGAGTECGKRISRNRSRRRLRRERRRWHESQREDRRHTSAPVRWRWRRR